MNNKKFQTAIIIIGIIAIIALVIMVIKGPVQEAKDNAAMKKVVEDWYKLPPEQRQAIMNGQQPPTQPGQPPPPRPPF